MISQHRWWIAMSENVFSLNLLQWNLMNFDDSPLDFFGELKQISLMIWWCWRWGFEAAKAKSMVLELQIEGIAPEDCCLMVVFITKHGDCCTKTWLQQHIKGAKSERNAYSGDSTLMLMVSVYVYIYIIWFIRATHIYIYGGDLTQRTFCGSTSPRSSGCWWF